MNSNWYEESMRERNGESRQRAEEQAARWWDAQRAEEATRGARQSAVLARQRGILSAEEADRQRIRSLSGEIAELERKIEARGRFRGTAEEFEAAWPDLLAQLLAEEQARATKAREQSHRRLLTGPRL